MIKKIICLTMLFILMGCSGIPFVTNKNTINIPSIHEGTKAIEMSYLENMPPKELFENQLFEIGLELQNAGATDIQNGMYNIAVNEQFVTLVDEKMNRFNIPGKSIYSPLGNKKQIKIQARSNALGGQITKQSTTIIANACYEYKTQATILTCIDTQPLKKEAKVCEVKAQQTSGGQGGPVAVVHVEPKIMPHEDPDKIKPTYILTIENRGQGQVIDPSLIYEICLGRSIGKTNYDTVFVTAMLSNEILNCEPQMIKLKQNENKILCELNAGITKNAGNYQTPLTVELEYGYLQTLPKTIIINKRTY